MPPLALNTTVDGGFRGPGTFGCQPPKYPLVVSAAAWVGPRCTDEPDNGGVARKRASVRAEVAVADQHPT